MKAICFAFITYPLFDGYFFLGSQKEIVILSSLCSSERVQFARSYNIHHGKFSYH